MTVTPSLSRFWLRMPVSHQALDEGSASLPSPRHQGDVFPWAHCSHCVFLLGAGERLVESLGANFSESSGERGEHLGASLVLSLLFFLNIYFILGSGVTSVTSARLPNCSHLDPAAPSPLSRRSSGYSLIEMPNEVPGVSCRDGAN